MKTFGKFFIILFILSIILSPAYSKEKNCLPSFYLELFGNARSQFYNMMSAPADEILMWDDTSWLNMIRMPNRGANIFLNLQPSWNFTKDFNLTAEITGRIFNENYLDTTYLFFNTNNVLDKNTQCLPLLTLQTKGKNNYFQFQAGSLNNKIASYSSLLLTTPGTSPLNPFVESDTPYIRGFSGKLNANANSLEVFNGYTFYPGAQSRQVYGGHFSKVMYGTNKSLTGGLSLLQFQTPNNCALVPYNKIITGDLSFNAGPVTLSVEGGDSYYSPDLISNSMIIKSSAYRANLFVQYKQWNFMADTLYEQPNFRLGVDAQTAYTTYPTGNILSNSFTITRYLGKHLSLNLQFGNGNQLNSTVFQESGIIGDDNVSRFNNVTLGLTNSFENGCMLSLGLSDNYVSRDFSVNPVTKLDYRIKQLEIKTLYPVTDNFYIQAGVRNYFNELPFGTWNDARDAHKEDFYASLTYVLPNNLDNLTLTYKKHSLLSNSNVVNTPYYYYGQVEAVELNVNLHFD